ncbi:MAG TPA: type VI secretion system baseplate subunit TssG [Aquabacterium sp.]|nr:type VI secretion system baseplate subunit TssG [Aquabacterium sp.]
MPAPQRRHHPAVIDQLLQHPQEFAFFQAVRLLDRWLAPGAWDGQGLHRVQFRNSISLAFPVSEIESLTVQRRSAVQEEVAAGAIAIASHADVERVEMTPACMGLLGVAGALPLFYTEAIAHQTDQRRDDAARAFMDVFSHRAVALFYQAWRKHRLPIQYERDRRDRYLPLVLSLAGMGQAGLRQRLRAGEGGVADESLAYFAGALQQRRWSASQMQQLLSRYLGVAVRVEQFVGRWYRVPEPGRTSLGRSVGLGRGSGVLGRSAMLGDRVWQRDLCMRLKLGPLDRRHFLRFLPGAPGAVALREWLTMFTGMSLEYEINLQLRHEDVRGSALDSRRSAGLARLGWDTFLQTRPAPADRTDVRYDIQAAV